MKKYSIILLIVVAAALVVVSGGATGPAANTGHSRPQDKTPPYHEQASTESLPATLEPSQFQANRVAFAAYTLAARVKQVLYQVPCYCGCDRHDHHQSLLDCFTSTHGERCKMCQMEAVFCFVQHRSGKNPAQIRSAVAKGKAWRVDLGDSIDRMVREQP
jgi:hypothetical protein